MNKIPLHRVCSRVFSYWGLGKNKVCEIKLSERSERILIPLYTRPKLKYFERRSNDRLTMSRFLVKISENQ